MTDEKTEILAGDPGQRPRLGRYRLERRLGAGGMAEVFLARAEGPAGFEKQVVVKRIRPALVKNPRFVDMFLREAKVLASLDHQNIVRIIELDADQGEYFLALEYLEGLSLREVAERHWSVGRPLPIEPLIQIIADAALGLDHAHSFTDPAGRPQNVIHRDVSPDNLFVTQSGTTKLIDFGIAKKEGLDQLTQAGELKGKVPFMAPELLHGETVDSRADLFSMGVVLYWLLTGRRPFDGMTDVHTMKAILEDEPRPPRALNPRVPLLLEQLVLSLLEKDREKRMQSAGTLHDTLLTLLVGLPRGAPAPQALVEAARRWPHVDHEVIPPGLAAAPALLWPDQPPQAPDDPAALPTRMRIAAVPLAADTQKVAIFAPAADTLGPATELTGVDVSTDEAKRASASAAGDGLPSDPIIDVERVRAASVPLGDVAVPPSPLDVSAQPTLLHQLEPNEDGGQRTAPDLSPVVLPSMESPTFETSPVVMQAPSRALPVLAGVATAVVVAVAAGWFGGFFGARPFSEDEKPVLVVAPDAGVRVIAPPPVAAADAGEAAVEDAGASPASSTAAVAAGGEDAGAAAEDDAVDDAGGADDAGGDEGAGEPAGAEDAGASDKPGDEGERGGGKVHHERPHHPVVRRVALLAPGRVQWQGANGEVLGSGNHTLRIEGSRVLFAVDTKRGGRTRVVVDARTNRVDYKGLPHQLLDVRARPFAEVFIGKERLGITPLRPVDVVAGSYDVKLVYKGIVRMEHVEVKPGHMASLNVVMQR